MPQSAPRFLIAESGTPEDRKARRDDVGKSSGETFAATLRQMVPGCNLTIAQPSDEGAPAVTDRQLTSYDAVFVSGSPMHAYERTPAVERQLEFMRAVFRSGVPSFGSCAGLQAAVAAAGGTVRAMEPRMEAGISRGIAASDAGRAHPLLKGRPTVWDAPALHGDEVEQLPSGAQLLAGNGATRVQAAEIRFERGIFWGVQYHPELSIGEIGAALKRQADTLVQSGLAKDTGKVSDQAALYLALDRDPANIPLRWRLGVDGEFADEGRRRLELRNFIRALGDLDRR
ncbi:MAG: gamma-glutamyl-gamma-aminobutyrate hydrolase family protein [Pontixanthobacter sp.]